MCWFALSEVQGEWKKGVRYPGGECPWETDLAVTVECRVVDSDDFEETGKDMKDEVEILRGKLARQSVSCFGYGVLLGLLKSVCLYIESRRHKRLRIVLIIECSMTALRSYCVYSNNT